MEIIVALFVAGWVVKDLPADAGHAIRGEPSKREQKRAARDERKQEQLRQRQERIRMAQERHELRKRRQDHREQKHADREQWKINRAQRRQERKQNPGPVKAYLTAKVRDTFTELKEDHDRNKMLREEGLAPPTGFHQFVRNVAAAWDAGWQKTNHRIFGDQHEHDSSDDAGDAEVVDAEVVYDPDEHDDADQTETGEPEPRESNTPDAVHSPAALEPGEEQQSTETLTVETERETPPQPAEQSMSTGGDSGSVMVDGEVIVIPDGSVEQERSPQGTHHDQLGNTDGDVDVEALRTAVDDLQEQALRELPGEDEARIGGEQRQPMEDEMGSNAQKAGNKLTSIARPSAPAGGGGRNAASPTAAKTDPETLDEVLVYQQKLAQLERQLVETATNAVHAMLRANSSPGAQWVSDGKAMIEHHSQGIRIASRWNRSTSELLRLQEAHRELKEQGPDKKFTNG